MTALATSDDNTVQSSSLLFVGREFGNRVAQLEQMEAICIRFRRRRDSIIGGGGRWHRLPSRRTKDQAVIKSPYLCVFVTRSFRPAKYIYEYIYTSSVQLSSLARRNYRECIPSENTAV